MLPSRELLLAFRASTVNPTPHLPSTLSPVLPIYLLPFLLPLSHGLLLTFRACSKAVVSKEPAPSVKALHRRFMLAALPSSSWCPTITCNRNGLHISDRRYERSGEAVAFKKSQYPTITHHLPHLECKSMHEQSKCRVKANQVLIVTLYSCQYCFSPSQFCFPPLYRVHSTLDFVSFFSIPPIKFCHLSSLPTPLPPWAHLAGETGQQRLQHSIQQLYIQAMFTTAVRLYLLLIKMTYVGISGARSCSTHLFDKANAAHTSLGAMFTP